MSTLATDICDLYDCVISMHAILFHVSDGIGRGISDISMAGHETIINIEYNYRDQKNRLPMSLWYN